MSRLTQRAYQTRLPTGPATIHGTVTPVVVNTAVQGLTRSKHKTMTPVLINTSVQTLSKSKHQTLSPVVETTTLVSLSRSKHKTLTAVTVQTSVQPLVRSKHRTLTTVIEQTVVRPLSATLTAFLADIVSTSLAKISRQAGFDASNVTIQANRPFVEYDLRVVSAPTATRVQGTSVETAVVASTTSLVTELTDDELIAAGAAEGNNIIKAFVKDANGNWTS